MRPLIVLATDPLAREGLALLEAEPEIEVRERPGLTADELLGEVGTVHALLVRSGTQVTERVLDAARELKVVGRAGSGVDNIDVAAATRRGVVVMNTPGGNSVAACEHTLALLFALYRNLPRAAAELAQGTWNRKQHMGRQLLGKTLGVVGFGRIGREVATRARALGMDVLVSDPFATESLVREWDARLLGFEDLLARADVVTLHLPLTDDSRHLMNAETLARMKPGASLINCARGGLVDETALLEAVDAGRLGGAALDVFEEEPPADRRLLTHPRIVCTPHLGASTEEAQRDVATLVAEQVRDYLLRGEVRNAVNMPSLTAEVYAQIRPYLELGERLGAFAAQLAGPDLQRVEIRFRGTCRDLPRAPVSSSVLVGLLGVRASGDVVNYVNARSFAEELGLAVDEQAVAAAGEHAGLLEVRAEGPEGACTIAGIVTALGTLRLARWEGLGLDAPAEGELLALRNPDVPGVVGVIGTLLGDAGVNIAHIAWGRDAEKHEAFTLIHIDGAVSDTVFAGILEHDQVLWATRVRLPGSAADR
jgi:D-3-phosphoglycerate dehydrogenase